MVKKIQLIHHQKCFREFLSIFIEMILQFVFSLIMTKLCGVIFERSNTKRKLGMFCVDVYHFGYDKDFCFIKYLQHIIWIEVIFQVGEDEKKICLCVCLCICMCMYLCIICINIVQFASKFVLYDRKQELKKLELEQIYTVLKDIK